MSDQSRVNLTRVQINFLREMLEIDDDMQSIKRFAEIMAEERVSPKEMIKVINLAMNKVKAK